MCRNATDDGVMRPIVYLDDRTQEMRLCDAVGVLNATRWVSAFVQLTSDLSVCERIRVRTSVCAGGMLCTGPRGNRPDAMEISTEIRRKQRKKRIVIRYSSSWLVLERNIEY